PHSSISTPPRADTSPLSLHDALPICSPPGRVARTQDRARHVRAATSSGRRGSRRARSCSSPRVPPPDSSQRWSFCTPEELGDSRSEEHTSELQSRFDLVCRLLLEKKK